MERDAERDPYWTEMLCPSQNRHALGQRMYAGSCDLPL